MPQRVVLEIRYPGKQTETNERLSVMFESWPEFNEETEWPKIEQHLQKLRLREKLDNCTVHYYKSSSDHLELKDSSSLAALAQRLQLQKLLPLRFIPLMHVRDGNGGETAYDRFECLGRGGFGVVFEVRDRVSNKRHGLKMSLPDENSLQSMKNEIDTLLKLDHPNIIRPLSTGDVWDPVYGCLPVFLMELGLYSVAELHSEPYKKAAAKAVVKQVTAALLYLYEKGFGHMDLTASNILVTSESACSGELQLEVKLIDAGGAGKLGTDLVTQRTKGFSNPILFSGNRQPPVSFCQDVFSLIKTVRELAGSHFIIVLDLLDELSRIAERFGDNRDAVIEGVRFQPEGAQYRTVFSLCSKAFKVDMGDITFRLSSHFLRKQLTELTVSQQISKGQDMLLRFALLENMMISQVSSSNSEALREQWDDAMFVLGAMRVHRCALMFASKQLQKEAVQRNGSDLQFVSEDLQADGQVVLEAVQRDGSALQFASKDLQRDLAIVLAAVQQNGSALQFASEDLQGDRQVVVEAVRQQRPALRFASKDLQRDETIVQEAVRTLQVGPHSEVLKAAAIARALQDDSQIEAVTWYTMPLSGWARRFGYQHSVVLVKVNGFSYAIERACPGRVDLVRQKTLIQDATKKGLFVSDWEDFLQVPHLALFEKVAPLQDVDIKQGISPKNLVMHLLSFGEYNTGSNNSHHTAMEVFNFCTERRTLTSLPINWWQSQVAKVFQFLRSDSASEPLYNDVIKVIRLSYITGSIPPEWSSDGKTPPYFQEVDRGSAQYQKVKEFVMKFGGDEIPGLEIQKILRYENFRSYSDYVHKLKDKTAHQKYSWLFPFEKMVVEERGFHKSLTFAAYGQGFYTLDFRLADFYGDSEVVGHHEPHRTRRVPLCCVAAGKPFDAERLFPYVSGDPLSGRTEAEWIEKMQEFNRNKPERHDNSWIGDEWALIVGDTSWYPDYLVEYTSDGLALNPYEDPLMTQIRKIPRPTF